MPLSVEMARTEDEGALARVRDLNTALIADADIKKRGPGAGGKLDSIRDEHARLIADNQRMADEARALRERYGAMEAQASAASRQSAELSGRVASLTAELGGLRSGLSAADATKAAHDAEVAKLRGAVAELSSSLERTKARGAEGAGARPRCRRLPPPLRAPPPLLLLLLQTELLSLSKEHEAHVNQSKPYIQMQQLLRRKNQQLAEVRAQLRKCVWACVGEATQASAGAHIKSLSFCRYEPDEEAKD